MPSAVAPAALGALQQALGALVAFGVSFMPEELKRHERVEPYATVSMTVAGAAAQIIVSVGLFIVAMLSYVTDFTDGPGWDALTSMPDLDTGHLLGVGALGYLSFFVTPQGLLLVYFFGEGVVRALEASLTGRMLGTLPTWAVWRLALALDSRARAMRLALLLGPPRPDELVMPERSAEGLLEVYSIEQKPWSEVQVVEHGGGFYQLASRELVPHGGHHAFRYLLHPLEEREVIRGRIVRLGDEAVHGIAPAAE